MWMVKRSFHSEAARGVAITAFGTLLVAATYGMARFGVGLLHPAMTRERPGVAAALPSAGAAQFASYCLAAGLAALLVPRRSRAVAGAAGAVAGAGCLGLAASTSAAGSSPAPSSLEPAPALRLPRWWACSMWSFLIG
jgi:hypothetical protein